MKLATSTRYAIRLLFELHRADKPLSMASISHSTGLTPKAVAGIHDVLKKNGITTAEIGPKGGLRLVRPLNEISLGQVLEWFNDTIEVTVCCGEKACICPQNGQCASHPFWQTLSGKMQATLNAVMLADIADAGKHL